MLRLVEAANLAPMRAGYAKGLKLDACPSEDRPITWKFRGTHCIGQKHRCPRCRAVAMQPAQLEAGRMDKVEPMSGIGHLDQGRAAGGRGQAFQDAADGGKRRLVANEEVPFCCAGIAAARTEMPTTSPGLARRAKSDPGPAMSWITKSTSISPLATSMRRIV